MAAKAQIFPKLMQRQDVPAIAAVFTASVHQLGARSYSPAQCAAWAPVPPDIPAWRQRLGSLTTLVAEADARIGGFIAFDAQGHIAFLYTSPDHARSGVASALYAAAVERLAASGVHEYTTEASLQARPFFERQGFTVVAEQNVERNGVSFLRYAMRHAAS